jgi:hypothetical protein
MDKLALRLSASWRGVVVGHDEVSVSDLRRDTDYSINKKPKMESPANPAG